MLGSYNTVSGLPILELNRRPFTAKASRLRRLTGRFECAKNQYYQLTISMLLLV